MPKLSAEVLKEILEEQMVTITRREWENLKRQIAELSEAREKIEGVEL